MRTGWGKKRNVAVKLGWQKRNRFDDDQDDLLLFCSTDIFCRFPLATKSMPCITLRITPSPLMDDTKDRRHRHKKLRRRIYFIVFPWVKNFLYPEKTGGEKWIKRIRKTSSALILMKCVSYSSSNHCQWQRRQWQRDWNEIRMDFMTTTTMISVTEVQKCEAKRQNRNDSGHKTALSSIKISFEANSLPSLSLRSFHHTNSFCSLDQIKREKGRREWNDVRESGDKSKRRRKWFWGEKGKNVSSSSCVNKFLPSTAVKREKRRVALSDKKREFDGHTQTHYTGLVQNIQ